MYWDHEQARWVPGPQRPESPEWAEAPEAAEVPGPRTAVEEAEAVDVRSG